MRPIDNKESKLDNTFSSEPCSESDILVCIKPLLLTQS